jgi:hypothetical protein
MNKKLSIFLLLCVVLLVGLFILLKPHSQAAKPTARTFVLVVKNNKLISGPTVLNANQGDTVTIQITADVDGELHLHGYDKHIDFKKNLPDKLTLKTDIAGHFVYELEDTKTEIGALDVQPK